MVDVPGSSSTSSVITVGGTLTNTLEVNGDHDWFRVDLVAGQKYTITLNGITLEDPYLRLHDLGGTIVAENDDISLGSVTDSRIFYTAATTGTYFIDVGAFHDTYAGSYQLHVENYTPPAVASYATIANHLVSGYWGGDSHHFAVTQGGTITVNLTLLTAPGQTLARQALLLWTDVIGVNFAEVSSGGQITFDDTETGAFADANYSGGITTSAHVNVSTQWLTDYGTSLTGYAFQTYIHEIGHALGLGHAGFYNSTAEYGTDAEFANDAWPASIMSYFDQRENTYYAALGYTRLFATTPMLADIRAVATLYGLSTTTRLDDTIYGFGNTSGRSEFNSTGTTPFLQTIVDSGGIDTINYGNFTVDQRIDLNQEVFSNVGGGVGNLSIGFGTVIENAVGGGGNDTLIGNSANNSLTGNGGDDNLDGGNGNDILTGGFGSDILTGGGGADSFLDTRSGLNGDTIVDFTSADQIIFSDATLGGFTFSLTGSALTYSGGSLTLTGGISGTLVASAASSGGVQLAIQASTPGSYEIHNSDGTRTVVTSDVAGNQPWSQQWFNYDLQGRLASQDIISDDGSHTFIRVDADGSKPWAQDWFSYDAQGRLVSEDLRNDNGTHTFINVDAANTQPWAQDWFTYDAQGRLDSEDVRYDNGTHTFINLDQANDQPWAQDWFTYDAQGRLTSEDVRFDNGTHTFIRLDADNSQAWAQDWFTYDAQGRLTSEDLRNDNGSHTFITVDAANAQTWAQEWFNYDTLGHLTSTSTVYDDGHVTYALI